MAKFLDIDGLKYYDEKIQGKIKDINSKIITESENGVEDGDTLSLVTTGEKYNWNNKSKVSASTNGISNTITTITIDGTKYDLPKSSSNTGTSGTSEDGSSGTSGGSTVEIDNILKEGVSIGDISIDGDTYSLKTPEYKLSIPDNSSDISLTTTITRLSSSEEGTIETEETKKTSVTMPFNIRNSIDEAEDGNTLSLVTTGEKYIWNHKSDLELGDGNGQAARGDHTHSQYLTAESTLNANKLSGNIPEGCYTNTTYSVYGSDNNAGSGLVPAPPTTEVTTRYLRADGTWETPPDTNTTYSVYSEGKTGLVPPINVINASYYLCSDGSWSEPSLGKTVVDTITEKSTTDDIPSAKAVYDFIKSNLIDADGTPY